MLGPAGQAGETEGGAVDRPRALDRPQLREECRALKERLLAIAQALGALREDIDRALAEGRVPKEAGARSDERGQ